MLNRRDFLKFLPLLPLLPLALKERSAETSAKDNWTHINIVEDGTIYKVYADGVEVNPTFKKESGVSQGISFYFRKGDISQKS